MTEPPTDASAAQIDALLAVADGSGEEGIDFDGLSIRRDDGYAISAPGFRRHGLSTGELREAAREIPAFVTNWHYWTHTVDAGDARYAFLRWLERADERVVTERYADLDAGVTRTWGQLAVTVRADENGRREYGLRHEDDLDADPGELEAYADPLCAREIAKLDDDGRYRPLKTAPTLQTGWRFDALDATDLLRAVDFLYPATIENWHLERRGELDVTHWRASAERQTGIYETVSGLPDEAVAWAAETCCVDSQCLKRRRWDLDDDEALGVERGSGEFPCREPCSLFIAAAREWTTIEREDSRTYEFELTPSEREQVEAIVDAVAEGRIGEVREADFEDSANRYRARYLRAKRFGDDLGDDGDGEE